MTIARRFLIASSLTRLIRKERGSERVTEGHFAPQADRQSHVRIEKGQAYLVLTSLDGDINTAEDWTDVPRSHAEALLDVCPGTVIFERSRLRLRNHEALVDRFVTPGPLDLVSVEFSTETDADAFLPPVWFGPEVTNDEGYTNRVIAISGRPRAPEVPLSNAALETALDLLESRPGDPLFREGERSQERTQERTQERSQERQAEDSAFDRLRRLAAVRPASPLPPPPAAAPDDTEERGSAEAIAQFRPRRPVVQTTPEREDDSDERLAGVIQGLSEALSQSAAEKDERYGG